MEKTTVARSNKKNYASSSSDSSSLYKFFTDELRDIYWAEKHLVKALPKMQKAATAEELGNAFSDHLSATEEQVVRIEEIFEMLGETARAKKCEAMEGLIKESESIISDTEDESATRDAGLIMAAQKVEHYEIATYGGLVQIARLLGKTEVANKLQETLDEEKEADKLLTSIAENSINIMALNEDSADKK